MDSKKQNSQKDDHELSKSNQQSQVVLQNQQSQQWSHQPAEKNKKIQKTKKQQPIYTSQIETRSIKASQLRQQQQIQSQINKNQPQYQQQPQQSQPEISSQDLNEMLGEDELFESVNQRLNRKQAYDLEQGISLSIQTLHQHFQFSDSQDQTIPVMVSVKTLEQASDMDIESNLHEERPNIDLVCVIDNSGSMCGEKIKNVKKTIQQLIDMLNDNDRLSLITFNSNSTKLCGLKKINNQNKTNLRKLIKQISAIGGTDIASGLQKAFSVLQSRKYNNHVSSIFLLSDGQDNGSDTRIKNLLKTTYQQLQEECFTIHSFGFGNDHDGPLMQRIAQIKDGSFYYVERNDQVDEFFVDALGGLFSVVAQDINISIQINKQSELFQKYFKNCYVSKTYGPMWKTVSKKKEYAIRINQIFSGVSKDYIFEITIPKSDIQQMQDFERNLEAVNVQLTATSIDLELNSKVVKENKLVLTLFAQNENIAQNSDINENVEFNYLRVKAAQAMEESIQLANKNQYQKGQVILQDIIKKIENSHPNNSEKLSIIKEDLIQCQQNISPQQYKLQGQYQAQQQCNNHFNQQSYAIRGNKDLYQAPKQKQMVSQLQLKKKQSQNKK